MKNKFFILIAASFLIAAGVKAQTTGSVDSCRIFYSLYDGDFKANNYKDAYDNWKKLYDACPSFTRNMYGQGVSLLKWKMEQETDVAAKKVIFDDMMKLYDDRVKYFSNVPQYGKDWIIARKAKDYYDFNPESSDHNLVYKWTGDILNEFGNKSEPSAINLYMFSSMKIMQSDDSKKEQYINDFLKAIAFIDTNLAEAKTANNAADIESFTGRKKEIEGAFVVSGASDCDVLEKLYAPQIEANKDNLEFLNKTLSFFGSLQCTETDAYHAASEYVYKIAPTSESARGLGSKAYKNGDMDAAEKYFMEALELTDDVDIKATMNYILATIAVGKNQYPKAKQLATNSLANDPKSGRAHLLIARIYASSASGFFPDDAVKRKCIFSLAIDRLEKARQADPSLSGEVNKYKADYTQRLPTKEEDFMHPDIKEGENFTIGGWINETTKLRVQP